MTHIRYVHQSTHLCIIKAWLEILIDPSEIWCKICMYSEIDLLPTKFNEYHFTWAFFSIDFHTQVFVVENCDSQEICSRHFQWWGTVKFSSWISDTLVQVKYLLSSLIILIILRSKGLFFSHFLLILYTRF